MKLKTLAIALVTLFLCSLMPAKAYYCGGGYYGGGYYRGGCWGGGFVGGWGGYYGGYYPYYGGYYPCYGGYYPTYYAAPIVVPPQQPQIIVIRGK